MYLYRFVFFGKYRRPVSVVEVRADNKTDAYYKAKSHMTTAVRGYTMQKRLVWFGKF